MLQSLIDLLVSIKWLLTAQVILSGGVFVCMLINLALWVRFHRHLRRK